MQFTSGKIDLVILRGNDIESLALEGTWVVSDVRLSANITHRPHCKANSIFYGMFNKTTTHGTLKTKKSVYIIVFARFRLPNPLYIGIMPYDWQLWHLIYLCLFTWTTGIWTQKSTDPCSNCYEQIGCLLCKSQTPDSLYEYVKRLIASTILYRIICCWFTIVAIYETVWCSIIKVWYLTDLAQERQTKHLESEQ